MSVSYRNSIVDFSGSHFKEKHNYKILPEHTAIISHPLPIALSDLEVHQLTYYLEKLRAIAKLVISLHTHSTIIHLS